MRVTIETLVRCGVSHREISRRTGVDRKTIRRYAILSNSPGVATGSDPGSGETPPPRPPAPDEATAPTETTVSACEPHRVWVESQVQLGRNAQSIYQDLVERHGFEHRYNSVKRFVASLKAREPERFDVLEEGDRLFNPSRETDRLLQKAGIIGPMTEQMAQTFFARLGRPGQRAIYGLTNLPRTYSRAAIEAVCGRLLEAGCVSYAAVRRALERQAAAAPVVAPAMTQEGPAIRAIAEYQSFWEEHSQTQPLEEDADAHVPC